MKRYVTLALVVWFVALSGAFGDVLDDQYIRIFNLIQEADMRSGFQPSQAL